MSSVTWFHRGLAIVLALSWQAAQAKCPGTPPDITAENTEILWQDDFTKSFSRWGELKFQFGVENMAFVSEPDGRFPKFLRVQYPRGSYDPGTALKGLAPMGGMQFTSRFANIKVSSSDAFLLTYSVRFDRDFDFVLGGKLPGLYGGIPKSGGHIPSGRDGFQVRVVWQRGGKGALYAYLPTSSTVYKGITYGTVLGPGAWQFRPGEWMEITQYMQLNQPGDNNGRMTVWIDGTPVLEACGLRFRDVPSLKIDGIFFSTFFGGNEPEWASRKDTHADFADFRLSQIKKK